MRKQGVGGVQNKVWGGVLEEKGEQCGEERLRNWWGKGDGEQKRARKEEVRRGRGGEEKGTVRSGAQGVVASCVVSSYSCMWR